MDFHWSSIFSCFFLSHDLWPPDDKNDAGDLRDPDPQRLLRGPCQTQLHQDSDSERRSLSACEPQQLGAQSDGEVTHCTTALNVPISVILLTQEAVIQNRMLFPWKR